MELPAGCKNVKLNLPNAYRTTYTHLVPGDRIRVRQTGGGLDPAATIAPKSSFWAEVRKVERYTGGVTIVVWFEGESVQIRWTAAHTAITRAERGSERVKRLAADEKARLEALASVEATLETAPIDKEALTATRVDSLLDSGARPDHLTNRSAALAEAQAEAARLEALVTEDPRDVAVGMVQAARALGSSAPYAEVLDHVDFLTRTDLGNADHHMRVADEVRAMVDQAKDAARETRESMTPKFPQGTPEYAAYATDLKAELEKYKNRQAPYDGPDAFDLALDAAFPVPRPRPVPDQETVHPAQAKLETLRTTMLRLKNTGEVNLSNSADAVLNAQVNLLDLLLNLLDA